ncbi:MAG: aspartate 1-decarboxylase [Lentisphaeria bacterium]|nr:aspartate 1-decarboxylase [Lentisphaeria bacterium]
MMHLSLLKSKIHKARITHCDLNYEGSLAIDQDLMDKVGMLPYEKILVVNATNGQRLETYAITAPRGSRVFCLNGAAARRGAVGDVITIMSFAGVTPEEAAGMTPSVIVLDAGNLVEAVKGNQHA